MNLDEELNDRLFHMAAAQELARRKFEGVPEKTILHVLTLPPEERIQLGSPIVVLWDERDSFVSEFQYRCNCKDRVPFSSGICKRCGHTLGGCSA